jgi:SAM-dependent methyltransferase
VSEIDPVAAAGFASAAEVYERARPSYPAGAVAWLVERAGLGPGSTVVDVGAGTGKLTRLLVATGAHVVAVEPVAEMRALIAGAEVLDGTAEELPLPDATADAVTAAQAFHWFDLERALAEIHRVLRPDGCLALVWNSRDLEDPLQRAVEDLLAAHRSRVPAQRDGRWRAPLAASPLFGDGESRRFRHEQRFTVDDLCDRVASTSFVAAMPWEERATILAQVRDLARDLPEPFSFPYVTEVHVFPRTGDRGAAEGRTSTEG